MAETEDQQPSRKLSTAAALLGKAQSTTFPAEQESLALGAYSQLAAFLNSLDRLEASGAGRRERRLLVDRRSPVPRPVPELPAAAADEPEVIDLRTDRARSVYRRPDGPGPGARIDLVL